jgi:hypothetical protein
MPDIAFACRGARAEPFAAAPSLLLDLELTEATGASIDAIALRCQLRIEPQRRQYSPAEESRLLDLFGEPGRWGETLKPLQLAQLSTMVPSFSGTIRISLPLPCSYDTEVAGVSYFRALDDGMIPLLLLFSGTVFSHGPDGLQVDQLRWDRDVAFRLQVATWREVMEGWFAGTAWLRARTESIEALRLFRARRMLTSWEDTIEVLLKEAGA